MSFPHLILDGYNWEVHREELGLQGLDGDWAHNVLGDGRFLSLSPMDWLVRYGGFFSILPMDRLVRCGT